MLLLEPAHIDQVLQLAPFNYIIYTTFNCKQVDARLGLLIQKLNTLNDKKVSVEEADKQGKV